MRSRRPRSLVISDEVVQTFGRMSSDVYHRIAQRSLQTFRGLDLSVGKELRLVLRQPRLYQSLVACLFIKLDVFRWPFECSRHFRGNLCVYLRT